MLYYTSRHSSCRILPIVIALPGDKSWLGYLISPTCQIDFPYGHSPRYSVSYGAHLLARADSCQGFKRCRRIYAWPAGFGLTMTSRRRVRSILLVSAEWRDAFGVKWRSISPASGTRAGGRLRAPASVWLEREYYTDNCHC